MNIYDKLMQATDSVNGNVMNDPGVKFFKEAIAPYFDTGCCEMCNEIVTMYELNSNAGICGRCVMKEETK